VVDRGGSGEEWRARPVKRMRAWIIEQRVVLPWWTWAVVQWLTWIMKQWVVI